MILTITLIIFGLVLLNLALLKFSCNKTKRSTNIDKKPIILRTRIVIQSEQQVLAPTGS